VSVLGAPKKFRPAFLSGVVEYAEACVDSDNEKSLRESLALVPEVTERAVVKRRCEFYSGRWAAAQAIARLTGIIDTPQVNSDRSPAWPHGLIGSITHTNDYALAAVARTSKVRRIGIDLESINAVAKVENLNEMICTKHELDLLKAKPVYESLALLFSAKESLYKSLYPEVGVYFDYLDVRLAASDESSLVLRLQKSLGDVFAEGDCFRVNYLVEDKHVLTWQIDLL